LAEVALVVLVVQQQHLDSTHQLLLQIVVLETPPVDLDSRDDFAGLAGLTGLAGQLVGPVGLDDGFEALRLGFARSRIASSMTVSDICQNWKPV
jgi:hypothetical protein